MTPSLMLSWWVAILTLLDVGNLETARENVWDRVAFLTRHGHCTLHEALVDIDRADADDYGAAIGRLIQQENAKRDT